MGVRKNSVRKNEKLLLHRDAHFSGRPISAPPGAVPRTIPHPRGRTFEVSPFQFPFWELPEIAVWSSRPIMIWGSAKIVSGKMKSSCSTGMRTFRGAPFRHPRRRIGASLGIDVTPTPPADKTDSCGVPFSDVPTKTGRIWVAAPHFQQGASPSRLIPSGNRNLTESRDKWCRVPDLISFS